MPKLVPTHTVHISRPHPNGRKDRDGNPIHERISPKIGEPFDFTEDEVTDIRNANPLGLREPINEGGETKEDSDVDRAIREAHEAAAQNRSAAGDAGVTARAGALGRGARKQPDNSGAKEVKAGDDDLTKTEEEDEL
jgi:hypothetical protein